MWKTAFNKLKEYGLLKQTISLQGFQRLSSTNFIWSIFEYFVPYVKSLSHNLVRYGFQHSKPCFHPNFSKAFSLMISVISGKIIHKLSAKRRLSTSALIMPYIIIP